MKYSSLFIGFILINSVTFAQKDKNIEPKTEYKVHKEYDANGNLKSYDSVYSWSYSSTLSKNELDSLMKELEEEDFFNESPDRHADMYIWQCPEDFPDMPDIDSIMKEIDKAFSGNNGWHVYKSFRFRDSVPDSSKCPNKHIYSYSLRHPDFGEFPGFSHHFDMDEFLDDWNEHMDNFEFFFMDPMFGHPYYYEYDYDEEKDKKLDHKAEPRQEKYHTKPEPRETLEI